MDSRLRLWVLGDEEDPAGYDIDDGADGLSATMRRCVCLPRDGRVPK